MFPVTAYGSQIDSQISFVSGILLREIQENPRVIQMGYVFGT